MSNTYEITAPDGQKYRITAPPGATEADAVNYVKTNIGNLTAHAPDQVGRNSDRPPQELGMLDSIKNSFAGGAVRGVRDIVDGGAQLATRTLEGLPSALGVNNHPIGQKFENIMSGQRKKVESINQNAEDDYRNNWRQGEDPGIDAGRIAGNIAASIPLGYAVPGMTASTTAGKTLYGAGAGLAGAVAQPVLNNNENFWDEKTKQAALGAATGAAGPHIANFVGKGVSKVKQAITPSVSREQAVKSVTEALNKKGVNFHQLAKETQDELTAQSRKALNIGADLNIDEIAAKSDFDLLGMKPTKGQLSLDPTQVRFEKNTSGITGAGDDLAQRFNQQNDQLIEGVNNLRTGQGMDAYQAGASSIDALTSVDSARQKAVGELYETAYGEVGIDTPLNTERFMKLVSDKLDDMIASADELPIGVNNKLKKIASGEIPFTIKKAEQVRKSINKRMGSASPSEKLTLKAINDSIQGEIDLVGEQAGKQAGQAFKNARSAAAKRFGQIDSSPAMREVVKDMATPDDFIKKNIINSKAGPLLALRNDIQPHNPEVWAEIKGQVVDHLKNKALSGKSDEFANFSASNFNKAMNTIGNAKLKVLFDPAEIKQLRTIGRVSERIANQPAGASVNNSNTAAQVANLLTTGSKIPLLQLAADPLKSALIGARASRALNPNVAIPKNAPRLPTQSMSGLNLPFSVAGYPFIKPVLE